MNIKKRKSTDYIVIHCSATPPHIELTKRIIDAWHRQRGFLRIGYHYVIRRDGEVERGRKRDVIGAHARNYNNNSVSICLAGGVDKNGEPEDNFTPDQMRNLTILVDQLKTEYPDAEVLGHRDLPGVNKACPSFDVKSWWAEQQTFIRQVFKDVEPEYNE